MTDRLQAEDESQALELLHSKGLTDGLPVVIPTPDRVARLLLATGLDADVLLGEMGPGNGAATVEKVAVAACMAGCLPDHMPVVLAAVQAVLQPEFDLTEMQSTTHCTAPLVIVNGPARHNCGPIASGFGALGPGHRANASIGRALRLCMLNIGGARPGESDMALLGHPGKFTYCLAEDEENSPLPPMHQDLGYKPDDSVVTVIGAEAPHSVIYSGDADDPDDAFKLLQVLGIGLANMATNNAVLTGGGAVVVLNPEHAKILARADMSRGDIQLGLWQNTHYSKERLAYFAHGFAERFHGEEYRCFDRPEDILVLMAGGSGLYSMVMPSWCAGANRNRYVSQVITTDQFCEVPTV
ncbi:MAG TPA: hypothetical protein DEF79_08010 [Gammaproteobacteria bacterium]|nr:hypothetical protein [Gammaproteobacteria bacterium]